MKLTLSLRDSGHIHVRCVLPVYSPTYSFALLHTLAVGMFFNNGAAVIPCAEEDCRLEFRPPMKKYTFSNLMPGELTFEYEGALSGFFLFMEEDLCHFSFYNGWYPMGFDAEERYDLTLLHDDSRTLVNGTYDRRAHCWRYTPQHSVFSDCNVLLYRPASFPCFRYNHTQLLFLSTACTAFADTLPARYCDILQFYSALYGRADTQKRTIVFLPPLKHCPGAYIRDRLIVFGQTYDDPPRVLHILAHELGHVYATGADTETWEDYLNETHAEWSALLYTLDHHPALFAVLIDELQTRRGQAPLRLRPDGNRRPKDVHTTGTLIYYDIFLRHGRKAIETLLQIFDRLSIKTNQSFLNALDQCIPDVADTLRRYL